MKDRHVAGTAKTWSNSWVGFDTVSTGSNSVSDSPLLPTSAPHVCPNVEPPALSYVYMLEPPQPGPHF
eukprot:3263860-Alexandrium_andersonii.AAC.1